MFDSLQVMLDDRAAARIDQQRAGFDAGGKRRVASLAESRFRLPVFGEPQERELVRVARAFGGDGDLVLRADRPGRS